jgi:hypothetical protein
MTMIDWTLIFYGIVAVVVFARMFQLALYLAKQSGQTLNAGDYVPSMLVDATFWLYFIAWYGLKNFLADLKKPQ